MGRMFLVNTPFFFRAVFNYVFKAFLDPVTVPVPALRSAQGDLVLGAQAPVPRRDLRVRERQLRVRA